MRLTFPVSGHPELSLLECPGWLEYRVENSRLVRGRERGTRGVVTEHWLDAGIILLLALSWHWAQQSHVHFAGTVCLIVVYAHSRCTEILWESVVVLPHLGIQLETHRGLPRVPLFTTRRFIPLSTLEDFIINEGIRRWSIRYYLAAIQRIPGGAIRLEVAFENLLPRFPVLLEIYHGVHETLLSDTSNRNIHTSAT